MIDVQTKNRQIIALSQLIHSCAASGLAGCIIGYGRGYAADAVPQLPEHWCSFCEPPKDDRLSQPHLVLIQCPTGLELRTQVSQLIHQSFLLYSSKDMMTEWCLVSNSPPSLSGICMTFFNGGGFPISDGYVYKGMYGMMYAHPIPIISDLQHNFLLRKKKSNH